MEPMAIQSWLNLEPPAGVSITWHQEYQYETAVARHRAVEMALQDDYDYLLQIDSDCVIPANTIDLLLELKQPFTTGCYIKKQQSRCYELYDWVNNHFEAWRELPTQPQPVAGCGMGCFMMDMSHMAEWPAPWFVNTQQSTTEPRMTEDLYFCRRLAREGQKIWMHPRVRVKHVGRWVWE